jgi:hypothetical protein
VRLAVPVVIVLFVVGCADEPRGKGAQAAPREPEGNNPTQRSVKPVHCPPSAGNCRSATGRVVFVEAVDPDGDGDLHVVLAGEQGITVVDIAPDLRPRRLPRMGDVVAAAGPVYRGSYGQRQIQADQVRYEHGR